MIRPLNLKIWIVISNSDSKADELSTNYYFFLGGITNNLKLGLVLNLVFMVDLKN